MHLEAITGFAIFPIRQAVALTSILAGAFAFFLLPFTTFLGEAAGLVALGALDIVVAHIPRHTVVPLTWVAGRIHYAAPGDKVARTLLPTYFLLVPFALTPRIIELDSVTCGRIVEPLRLLVGRFGGLVLVKAFPVVPAKVTSSPTISR